MIPLPFSHKQIVHIEQIVHTYIHIFIQSYLFYSSHFIATPQYGPRYNWSQNDQAMLLGAFFYGYMITSLPAGMLAENFGGKAVAGYSCLLAGILTALTPLAASWNMWAVWAIRFAIGFLTVSTESTKLYD